MSKKSKKKMVREKAAAARSARRFKLRIVLLLACALVTAGYAATRYAPVRRTLGLAPILTPTAQQGGQGNLALSKEYIYAGGRLVATEEPSATLVRPYPDGVPHAIPGTVQAEDFDNGGEGIAYHDIDTNAFGTYRPGAVYIENCANPDGGCNVGSTWASEWLEYTVEVAAAGAYNLEARVASGNGGGGTFRLDLDGSPITGTLTVPGTGGWQNYQTVSAAVTLPAGRHVIRLTLSGNGSAGGAGNYNYFRFTAGGAGPAPSDLIATAAVPTGSTTAVSLTWGAASGAERYVVERAEARGVDGPQYTTLSPEPTTNSFTDTTAVGKVYLYRVRAVFPGGGTSNYSNQDLATTVRYTGDDPLIRSNDPQGRPASNVKALNLTELRAVVEAVRALAGSGPATWNQNPAPATGVAIQAAHFKELREQLNPALAGLGISEIGLDPTIAINQPVRAAHIQDVREKVR